MILSIFSNIQTLLYVLLSLAGISFLITFHELGHFLICKLFDIKTVSFSIGFGPRLIEKKIGETTFALSAIPMGGYVEIAGANEIGQGEQKESHAKDKRSFAQKPYYQKMAVIFGGILFNLMFSFAAFSALYYIGMPKSPLLFLKHGKPVIESVSPDSPAQKAKLKAGDKIISIDNKNLDNNIIILLEEIGQKPNQQVMLTIERAGQTQNVPVTLGEQQRGTKQVGLLGVAFEGGELPRYGFVQAIKEGFNSTMYFFTQTFNTFKNMITSRKLDGVTGPIGIISHVFGAAKTGFPIFLLWLAIISISLAALNVIPLPIFDGGQALTYTIEALIRRELPEKVKVAIHLATWGLLLLLTVYITFNDLKRIVMQFLGK
ncbi:site-2 protease family protein [Candidatus Dependentiae bacterium]|nr:site-2 protease family protein [Candidatus Dependentiae bacterium]